MILAENNVDPSVGWVETLSAINALRSWFAGGLVEEISPSAPNAVYTSSLTMWMLVLQRLTGGKGMQAIVKDTIANVPAFVPNNKRVQNGQLSSNSSSFSTARKRLKLKTVRFMFDHISNSIIAQNQLGLGQRHWYLLDGTTMTLAPSEELKRCYPPANNQHGKSVWPVLMMFVAHEMQSGCATTPVFSPMYGSKNASELKLSRKILTKLPAGSVVMADAGLGIFSVAHGASQAKHDFLFRLTKARFNSLTKQAKLISSQADAKTWELTWRPTAKERKTTPSLPANAQLRVRVHEYLPEQGKPIYMVTSLIGLSCQQAAERYGFRYDVETDIKNIKVAMNTERIRAVSRKMVMKELYASLTAYNSGNPVPSPSRRSGSRACPSAELPRSLGYVFQFPATRLGVAGSGRMFPEIPKGFGSRIKRQNPRPTWTKLQTRRTHTTTKNNKMAKAAKTGSQKTTAAEAIR